MSTKALRYDSNLKDKIGQENSDQKLRNLDQDFIPESIKYRQKQLQDVPSKAFMDRRK